FRLADAVVWFADASQLEPVGWKASQAHRFRLSLAERQFPELVSVLTTTGLVERLELSLDGRRLLARTTNNVLWWDVGGGSSMTGKSIGKEASIFSAALNADGSRVVACSKKLARVWDIRTGALLADLPHTNGADLIVYHASFSPDGNWVVTGCEDGGV